jgi:cytochrome P450
VTAVDLPASAEGRVPPGVPRWTALGMLKKMVRDRLSVMSSVAAKYGDAVRLPLGPKTLYFFNHPDHAKHVLAENPDNYQKGIGLVHAKRAMGDGLLTSEGELWKEQRRTIRPVLAPRRIQSQAGMIAEEAAAMVARLRNRAGDGPVDIRQEMTDLTLGVLGRTLIDADLGEFSSIGESFEAVQDQAIFEMMSLSTVPHWLPLPGALRFRRARKDLQRIVDQLVADRKARGLGGDDIVSRLIDSTSKETDRALAQRRIRDELVTLLLAGHETTASTLSWTFYLMDQNPEVWDRVREEVVRVLGDRLPTFEDLHSLRYLSMVLDEAIRLFPPVWILPRIAVGPDNIGGYHVPAGADVLICPYTLHRHPDFWDSPNLFDPERFSPERSADRPRYAYVPFGAGPRFCIGNSLGMMEAAFVVALVARDLRLRMVPGYQVVPEPMLTVRVRGGLPMTVHPTE